MYRAAKVDCIIGVCETVGHMPRFWSTDDMVRYGDSDEKHGRLQEITANMHTIVDWHLDGTEEHALIITDTDVSGRLYHTLAGVLRTFGVEPTIAVIPLMDAPNNEPPPEIVGAVTETDVVVNMCRYSITHTEAIDHAINDLGKTYVLLADPTEDYFRQGAVTADPEEVTSFMHTVATVIERAEWIEVTSPGGTDVSFSVDGREPIFGEYPLGETPLCPVEETVNGTIVHDSFMMGIGILDEPITWEVEGGRIKEITGGREAAALRQYIDERGDENAYWIGEFSVQTQPAARPNGNYIEHKQVRGGVHFACGTGTDLGGKYQSRIHLDGVQLTPTVTIDGTTIIEDGEFDEETVFELAEAAS